MELPSGVRVIAIEGEEADRQIDRISKKYTGNDEYQGHRPDESRVKVVIELVSVS